MSVSQAPVKNGRTRLTFKVEDSGIGMSEKFQQHLFTPFEQEDGTVSRKYGGTGLGMAITKNLVSLLGGVIYVKSCLLYTSGESVMREAAYVTVWPGERRTLLFDGEGLFNAYFRYQIEGGAGAEISFTYFEKFTKRCV